MGFPFPFPLGLPKGSVRATMTLLLSINLVILSIYEDPVAAKLATVVAVALTFYFGGKMRATTPVPRSVEPSLRAWGLPAGTIRFLLIAIFGGGIYYIQYVKHNTLPDFFLEIIYVIVGYLMGTSFNRIKAIFMDPKDEGVDFLDHLKAIFAIAVTIFVVYLTQTKPTSQLTEDSIFFTSIFLGFYFGSRQ